MAAAKSSHDRFPGADIALQETVHWATGTQIDQDVVNCVLLCAGELERQGFDTRFHPFVGHIEDARGDRLPVTFLAQHAHLQEEDFIESQTAGAQISIYLANQGNVPARVLRLIQAVLHQNARSRVGDR